MTVENAHAYIESILKNGPSDDLHAQINVKFKSEHIHQALKERGTSKDELLKAAAGGSATVNWGSGAWGGASDMTNAGAAAAGA